ncbi:MAG: hypothetical protein FOGNACKC_00872 [Anaerolineae bacterium]|nr:hypothetical protein [Anaerolineae bacterium]
MMVFILKGRWPRCKHCGQPMKYWTPGLPLSEHAHPKCAGAALAARTLAAVREKMRKGLIGGKGRA